MVHRRGHWYFALEKNLLHIVTPIFGIFLAKPQHEDSWLFYRGRVRWNGEDSYEYIRKFQLVYLLSPKKWSSMPLPGKEGSVN